jgi:hypothetical protein
MQIVPLEDFRKLEELVEKIKSGRRNWTTEELELQRNYGELLEILLKNAKIH